MSALTESVVEDAALAWMETAGLQVAHGHKIAPDSAFAERADRGQVVLAPRVRKALTPLNPALSVEALEGAPHNPAQPENAAPVRGSREPEPSGRLPDGP